VTMPGMNRTALVFVALAVALGGCGTDSPAPADSGASEEMTAEMTAEIEAVTGDVADLTAEVERLSGEIRALRRFKRAAEPRFGRLGERLRTALDSLRASLAEVRSSAGAAAAESSDALARAEEVARDLAVLEQRYEVHMRRYHER
jgi:outer membrane murein-binding lipoprotein Lpp